MRHDRSWGKPGVEVMKYDEQSYPISQFEEQSNIDQDDSYGNYRPQFLIKKHKVAGRTDEIMKLQRLASTDKAKAILGPVQPDLTE